MSSKDTRTKSSNYRRPPVEHQFKKGTSGNYRGRPKKKAQPGFGASGRGLADRLAAMAQDEAMRLVTVREGEKTSQLPAIQAVLRTMLRAAAHGDAKLGGRLMDFFARTESQRAADAVEMLQFFASYKKKYGPMFEQHVRDGLDPPDIYPHPDDILIDEATGTVTIDGPTTRDQAGARKAVREKALQSFARYLEVEAALKKEPKNRALRKEFKALKVYYDFLRSDAERNFRHEALRASRRALEKPKSEDDTSD